MTQRDGRRDVAGAAALAGLALLAGACGSLSDVAITSTDRIPTATASAPDPRPAPEPRGVTDEGGVQAALDDVAAAFRAGSPDDLRPHLHDPASTFGAAWLEREANMADLPLAEYRLRLDTSLPDLATDRIRATYEGARVQVLYVQELLSLSDFDDEPAAEDLFLTLVDGGDGWKVASDRDGERLGFVSVDHLWDHGPVVTTVDGPIMALHHPDGPDPGRLVEEARAALVQADARWPLDWPQRVPIVIPRDEEELGELLHVTFDLSNFVAFATATSSGDVGEYALTGSRIVINPDRLLDRSTEIRQRILVHELIHVATRPVAGPLQPSWLEEGVAQALGEQRSTTGTGLVDAITSGALDLPTDGEFTVGGRDRVYLSYQLAWSFVDHLVARFGAEAVGNFYATVGQGSIGNPGTEAFHLDQGAREVFGVSMDDLITSWQQSR